MKISILIPTYNNLKYLKCLVNSLKVNSFYENELIVHVNEGSDGTLDFVRKNNITYSFSKYNIGLCSSINEAFKYSTSDFILYAHDDMYFCKDWDKFLYNEIKKQTNNLYYLTGTNVSTRHGLINFDCGDTVENFNETKFLNFCLNDNTPDLQSSHWAPHLIHREMWLKIGGFSEEFNPGDGSDPDFCMKLWNNNVRIFKGVGKLKVYHFNSITTRKKKIDLNNGTKQFILKYGFSPRFFRRYYLRGNNSIIPYLGKLSNPNKNLFYFYDLFKSKLKLLFYSIIK